MKELEEYLVKLSADIDKNSFQTAESSLNSLVGMLKKFEKLAKAAGIVSFFVGIGKAAQGIIHDVASADMEFKKLANQMWITKESAKSLSTAMKLMGASEEDLAWIPELREQFFRLRNEMNELATPVDAESQLRWIREIGYDIQSLQLRLKMLKEWIAYYLIKYLGPFLKEFQDFIQWLNAKLGQGLPEMAKKIARALATVVEMMVNLFKIGVQIVQGIYDFFDRLPMTAKRWVAVFAMIGAALMSGPFGMFLMAIGGALVLLQDFIYYMNGWNSSKTLAPIWETILKFVNGQGMDNFNSSVESLFKFIVAISKILDHILTEFFKGYDWVGTFNYCIQGFSDLTQGVTDLFGAISDVFKVISDGTSDKEKSRQRTFWSTLGEIISLPIKALSRVASIIGKIFSAVAKAMVGDFKGAYGVLAELIKGGLSGLGFNVGSIPSANEAANTAATMSVLTKNGMTKEGAAGLIGNLLAESRLDPSAIEHARFSGSYEEYMDGMTKDKFMNDEVGFGIAQWTSASRKGALWDYWQENGNGRQINDLGLQLEFLLKELNEDYNGLLNHLKSTDDLGSASNRVLHEFERPADQSYGVEVERQNNGEEVLDKYGAMAQSKYTFAANAGKYSGYMPTSNVVNNNQGSVNVGGITVNVAGTNASPQQIADAISTKILSTRYGRGALV